MSAGNIGQQIINGTYGLDNRPPTAYEELKAWCERHLNADEYKAIPENKEHYAAIYFEPLVNDNNVPCFVFNEDGTFQHSDVYANDEIVEHVEDYERTQEAPKPDPMPTSIGGMMVRKMIEAYERKCH